MLATVILIVLLASIVIFFSDEFIGLIKKIAKIPGVTLFVPLVIATWLFLNFEYLISDALIYTHVLMLLVVSQIAEVLPFKAYAVFSAQIILLTLLSVLPVVFFELVRKKRVPHPFEYRYLSSSILFVFFAMVLLVL